MVTLVARLRGKLVRGKLMRSNCKHLSDQTAFDSLPQRLNEGLLCGEKWLILQEFDGFSRCRCLTGLFVGSLPRENLKLDRPFTRVHRRAYDPALEALS